MRNYKKYSVLLIVLIVSIAIFYSWPESIDRLREAPAEQGASRLSQLLSDPGEPGFERAIEPRRFDFPADHGPHPGYRNEWWYLTGNLDAVDGRQFGYELTIFRFALKAGGGIQDGSAWRSNHVFVGHFAVSDIERDKFHVAQRYSRGSLGLAGATAAPVRVWVEDWSIEDVGMPGKTGVETDYVHAWQLQATADDFSLKLQLVAVKKPVLQGLDGLSQKSDGAGNASYYYSMSRLQSDGTLSLDGVDYPVSGLSWMDREWSSNGLGANQVGWDWFALQLEDGSELMYYALRNKDGTRDSHSAGALILANGDRIPLSANAVTIDILEYWDSPGGVRYPAAWHLRSSTVELDLEIRPLMADQELSTAVQYWEGAVAVKGRRAGDAVEGRGYVELTGYADTYIH